MVVFLVQDSAGVKTVAPRAAIWPAAFSGSVDWNGSHAAATHGYVAMSAIE